MNSSVLLAVALTILYEAGPDVNEMQRVASTMNNRYTDPSQRWGTTWEEVIWRREQFSWWNGRSRLHADIEKDAEEAKTLMPEYWYVALTLAMAMSEGTLETVTDATHFYRHSVKDIPKGLILIGATKPHKYYRED